MTDWIVKLYRKMNTTARRAAVLLLAFVIAMSTLHFMTFPATALTRKAGENDPGIVIGDETNTEGFDNASEGENTEVNPVNTETAPAEEGTTVIPEGEAPAPEDPTADVEPTPETTELTEPTETPDGNEEAAVIIEPTATPEVTPTPEPTETPAAEEEPEEESDSSADVETAADWEDMFQDVELTGVWADDLLTLAELQKGYKESTKNFVKDDEGKKYGYTRYGEWYGDPYAEWDSLFVMFNLYYAGITKLDFPYQADCEEWIDALKEAEMFHEVNTYVPNKGDLVFADVDEDNKSDHVAIVKAVEKDAAGNPDKLIVIEGNIDNEVKESTYEFYNPLIVGFGKLPENPEMVKEEAEAVEEAIAEEPEAEPVYATFEGKANNVVVTVQYEEGAFPEGTTMKVKPVWNPSVLGAINDTVTDKEVVKVQAVDIIFLNAEGKEIEPSKPIKVTMKSTSIPKQAEEAPVVVHVDDKLDTSVVEAEQAEEAEKPTEAVTFESDAFSVYAIVYTVDFAYSLDGRAFTFSMEGGTSMKLSALVEALGIIEETSLENGKAFVVEVNNVEFTNSTLLKVKKDFFGNDWTLTSLAPFTSQEALTITMNNGNVFTVEVTDATYENLASYITDAALVIDGNTYGAGTVWKVRKNVDYTLKLNFAEKGSRQFPKGGDEMIMDMPTGLSLEPGAGGSFDIPCGLAGTLKGNQWWISDDGKLHVKFADDPDKLLTRSSNVHFELELSAKFDGSQSEFKFNDNVTRNAEFDTSSDVDVSKSGSYNPATGKMEYTVVVKSTGDSENVKVTDAISGDMLTLDEGSITIEPSSKTTSSPTTNSKGFELVLGNMTHNETVTIRYTASVDYSKLAPGGKVVGENGTNKVRVESNGHNDEDTNITNTIKFSDTSKTNVSSTEIEGGTKVELEWKININEGMRGSVKGAKITDEIDYSSKDIMKYAVNADGKLELTITKKDQSGNTTTEKVLVNLNDAPYTGAPESWTWIPQDEGIYSYEITYKTIATKQSGSTTVKNKVDNENDHSATGTGVIPGTGPDGGDPEEDKIVAGKQASDVSSDYVEWTIVINVPEEGFPEKLEVIENIPYFGNKGFADEFVEIVGDIDGLINNETASVEVSKTDLDENGNVMWEFRNKGKTRDVVTIKFYRDTAKSVPGLDPKARTLTIKLKTKNSKEWMEYAAPRGGGDEAYYHRNYATINGKQVTDYAIPMETSIDKETDGGSTTADGLNVYAYKVTLTNITELPVVLEDTFNTNDLCIYGDGLGDPSSNRDKIAGAEQKHFLNGGSDPNYKIVVTPTSTGITITANDLPRKKDGSFFPYYQFYYRLQIKDQEALERIKKQAVANGGVYTIGNTVVWGKKDDHVDIEYEVPVLSKTGGFFSDSNDRLYTFFIDVNKNGLTVNNGQVMDLTDEHTPNLSVDYSSIKVYRITDGQSLDDATQYHLTEDMIANEVTWNFDANTGTFKIPDSTHYVIRYNALVIGNGEQSFSNEAEMKGFSSTKTDKKTYDSHASGGGGIYQINLLKYEAGQTSKGLAGAKFQLFVGTGEYDESGNEIKEPMKYGNTPFTRGEEYDDDFNTHQRNVVGEDITFTTGTDGTVMIALDQTHHGNQLDLNTHYYLKEIESPPGYQIDSSVEYWAFTLTEDSSEVNYGDPERLDERGRRQWIYFYYGDILKMANTSTTNPLDVKVDKSWFDEQGNPITGENLNDTYVATVQLLRKSDATDYHPVKVDVGSDGKPIVTDLQTGDTSGQVALNKDNNWEYIWSQLPRVKYGGEKGMEIVDHYAYKIEEVSVDGYIVSMTESETETVKTYALNNYKVPKSRNTDITVNKKWIDASGNELPGTTPNLPDNIYYYIYQVSSKTPFTRTPTAGGEKYFVRTKDGYDSHLVNPDADDTDDEYGLYHATKDENWSVTYANLPEVVTENGSTMYYAYYVKEVPMEGYTASYTSNGTTRTIVNREPLPEGDNINIDLEKKWKLGEELTNPPEGAHATFTLHQLKSTVSGGSSGNYEVRLLDGTTILSSRRANVGDTVTFSGIANAYSGTGVSLYRYYNRGEYDRGYTWFGIGRTQASANGGFSFSYVITEEDVQENGGVIQIKIDDNYSNQCSTPPSWDTGDPTYSGYEATGVTQTIQFPYGSAWTYTFKNLVKKDADGNLYKYYITEDECSPVAVETVFTGDIGKDAENAINTAGQKVEIINKYEKKEFALNLIKVDKTNPSTKLPGAEFTLQKVKETDASTDGDFEAVVKTTGSDGTTSFPGIANGYYMLSETKAPTNYILLGDDYIYIHVTDEGVKLATFDTATKEWNDVGSDTIRNYTFTATESTTTPAVVKVSNEQGVHLPKTGGSGTGMITILGSILILLGAGVLLLRRRRESL